MIKSTNSGSISIELLKGVSPLPDHTVLHDIVTKPNIWIPALLRLRLNDLLRLLRQTETLNSVSLQSACMNRIQSAMKTKYDMSKIPNFVLRVPFIGAVSRMHLHDALIEILPLSGLHKEVQRFVTDNIRIVTTRQKRVYDYLVNFRGFCKTLNLDHPPFWTRNHIIS